MYKNTLYGLCSSGNATEYNLFLRKDATGIQKRKHSDEFLGDHKQPHKGTKEKK